MKSWFVQVGPQIHGPIDVSEVEKLSAKHRDCLVWGKGMAEWLSYSEWKKNVLAFAEKEARVRLWQYRYNDQESKILKIDDLVIELKKLPSFDSVYVKSDMDPKWQLLFTSKAVTEKLGITRRTQLRVPIFGFFEGYNLSRDEDFRCKLATVSEGGIGFSEAPSLRIGQSIRGHVISPNLNQNIPITGDVVYTGPDGDIGVKFSKLPAESQSLVIAYVTKFKDVEAT